MDQRVADGGGSFHCLMLLYYSTRACLTRTYIYLLESSHQWAATVRWERNQTVNDKFVEDELKKFVIRLSFWNKSIRLAVLVITFVLYHRKCHGLLLDGTCLSMVNLSFFFHKCTRANR